MTASDFVNCSRTQSLVAQPDTSSTAAGISTPIFSICRITPSPLWALANVWNECEAAWESNNHARARGRSAAMTRRDDLPDTASTWRAAPGRTRGMGSRRRLRASARLHASCKRYTALVDGCRHVDVELLLGGLGAEERPGRLHLVPDRLEVVGVLSLGVVDGAELPQHPEVVGLAPGGGPEGGPPVELERPPAQVLAVEHRLGVDQQLVEALERQRGRQHRVLDVE